MRRKSKSEHATETQWYTQLTLTFQLALHPNIPQTCYKVERHCGKEKHSVEH